MELQDLIDMLAPNAGWEVEGDDVLICPCGDLIELDGTCEQGCRSPLLMAGMI